MNVFHIACAGERRFYMQLYVWRNRQNDIWQSWSHYRWWTVSSHCIGESSTTNHNTNNGRWNNHYLHWHGNRKVLESSALIRDSTAWPIFKLDIFCSYDSFQHWQYEAALSPISTPVTIFSQLGCSTWTRFVHFDKVEMAIIRYKRTRTYPHAVINLLIQASLHGLLNKAGVSVSS